MVEQEKNPEEKYGRTKKIEYSKIPKSIIQNYKIFINELNLEKINPSSEFFLSKKKKDLGADKIVVIGKPGSGKSILMKDILFHKKHIIPLPLIISETEKLNKSYAEIIPQSFIYNKYDEKILENFLKRQEHAKENLTNPWACLILDDCFGDPKHFLKPLQQFFWKNLRHYCTLYIVALQYALDIKPTIRINIDGVFIFKEPNLLMRKKIYDNFASIIPQFDLFCRILENVTEEHSTLFIKNNISTNNWQECVFWYQAKEHKDWRFGCDQIWDYHDVLKK